MKRHNNYHSHINKISSHSCSNIGSNTDYVNSINNTDGVNIKREGIKGKKGPRSDGIKHETLSGAIRQYMEVGLLGDVVCSMCGDVGIAELLFRCSKCLLRSQHIYCGRSYPVNLFREASVCNWCLHDQDSLSTSSCVEKASMVINDLEKASKVKDTTVPGNWINGTHPIEVLNNPVPAYGDEEYSTDEALVKIKGHGKAFDYLLLVAARSLPQVIREMNCEIKQASHTAPSCRITGLSDNKAIHGDTDKKSELGSTDHGNKLLVMGSLEKQARISNDTERLRTESIISKPSIEQLHTSDDGGRELSIAAGPASKYRKRGLQLSPARPINYRRYKLLTDVVC